MPHCIHQYAQQEQQLFMVHTVTNQPSHNESAAAATAMLVVYSGPRHYMLYCMMVDVAPVVPVTSSHRKGGALALSPLQADIILTSSIPVDSTTRQSNLPSAANSATSCMCTCAECHSAQRSAQNYGLLSSKCTPESSHLSSCNRCSRWSSPPAGQACQHWTLCCP